MKKTHIFFTLIFVVLLNLKNISQTIVKDTIFEVNGLNKEIFYDYFERINSKNRTIIPFFPVLDNEDDDNYTYYIIFDNNFSQKKIKIKKDRDIYNNKITYYRGTELEDNKFILLSYDRMLIVKLKDSCFKKIKKLKLPPDDCNGNSYNNIFNINTENSKFLLLTNTYNHTRHDSLFDNFRLALYNIKKQRIEKKISIDVGKGIYLSHFSYQFIDSRNNYIAIANPTKPEIYLFLVQNNKLQKIDSIKLNYPVINKTGAIIDIILPNEKILENKYNVSNLIKILNDNNVHNLPKIEKISFIDDDLLFIIINPLQNNTDTINKKLHFVYSLSRKEFYNNEGIISNYNTINSSQPLLFVENNVINIKDSVDINDKYLYFATVSGIYADFDLKTIEKFDTTLINVRYIESENNFYFKNYNYIMFSDFNVCSHCKFENKFEKILIIHTYDKEINKSLKLFYKKKYEQMFSNPKIAFFNESFLNSQIQKNRIYKIEK